MRPRTKVVSLASVSALLVGGAVFLPQAFADTKTATMNLACQAIPSTSLAGPQNFPTDDPIDVNVKVNSPEKVEVGEEFDTTFSIDPVNVAMPSLPLGAKLEQAWRLKLDFQLPDGAEYISGQVDDSAANLKGFTILRVNESGNQDPNGRILRLVDKGNNTIGNGPNSSTSKPGGVTYKFDPKNPNLNLAFPKITLRTKATKPGEMKFGVRTAGNAGNYAYDENFLTMGANTTPILFAGKVNVAVKCSPRALANANSPLDERATRLAVVKAEEKQVAQDSSVALTAAPAAKAGLPTELTAKVSPAEAEGTVVFTSGSMTSAAIAVENGVAKTQMTFPEAGTFPVTATFTPADTTKFNASSAESTVTVEGQEAGLQLEAPASVNAADGKVDVTAKVDSKAEGTVEFSIADGSVITQKVANGEATASLPLGDTVGATEVKAVFKPATGSPFKTATVTKSIDVKVAPKTAMTLTSSPEQVQAGEKVTVMAQIAPSEGTTDAKGKVTFKYAGTEKTVDVKENKAVLEVEAPAPGDFMVSAEYTPADNTQSAVTAETTIKVAEKENVQTNVSMQVALPELVEKGKPADATVTVSPAEAKGKVSALVEGNKVEAAVVDGKATLPLTFNQAGAQKVTFTFTPDDAEKYTDASNSADITVTEPGEVMPDEPGNGENPGGENPGGETPGGETPGDQTPSIPEEINDVTITPGETIQGEILLGEVEGKNATVTVKDAGGKGVFGTLKVLVDGKPAQMDGKDAEIMVVGGKAKWTMDIFDAGQHVVTLQFFDTKGALKGSKNVNINVKNVEVDPSNISK